MGNSGSPQGATKASFITRISLDPGNGGREEAEVTASSGDKIWGMDLEERKEGNNLKIYLFPWMAWAQFFTF